MSTEADTHDPLCPQAQPCIRTGEHTFNVGPHLPYCSWCGAPCLCQQIAAVRADERQKASTRMTDWIGPRKIMNTTEPRCIACDGPADCHCGWTAEPLPLQLHLNWKNDDA
jgi:hypothetical protein